MANAQIKISQLQQATTTQNADFLMFVQNGVNKKITIQTLLDNINSPVTFNKNKTGNNFVVNGLLQNNLFVANGSTNRVGVLTATPESTFQVVGDIQVGGSSRIEKNITTITAESTGTDGDLNTTRTITVTCLAHGFVANDKITISGVTGSDGSINSINGIKSISVVDNDSFTFTIPESANVATINATGAKATKITYFPGIYKDSLEEILVTYSQSTTVVPISSSYSITAINLQATSSFSLSRVGAIGQRKTIYLNSVSVTGDKATINNVYGLGFSKIQLNNVGDSVTLLFNGSKWVVQNSFKAIISN